MYKAPIGATYRWNRLAAPALCLLDIPEILSQEFSPCYIECPCHLRVEHTALLRASSCPSGPSLVVPIALAVAFNALRVFHAICDKPWAGPQNTGGPSTLAMQCLPRCWGPSTRGSSRSAAASTFHADVHVTLLTARDHFLALARMLAAEKTAGSHLVQVLTLACLVLADSGSACHILVLLVWRLYQIVACRPTGLTSPSRYPLSSSTLPQTSPSNELAVVGSLSP